jgi:hypothetical protein
MYPPQAAVGDPPPSVPVYVVGGVGYIEAGGTNMTSPPVSIIAAVGKVFQNAALAPMDPTPILGSCATATLDPMGMMYNFSRSAGNMVPGAQGGGSLANYLVTWALFKNDPGTWVRCINPQVQFNGS